MPGGNPGMRISAMVSRIHLKAIGRLSPISRDLEAIRMRVTSQGRNGLDKEKALKAGRKRSLIFFCCSLCLLYLRDQCCEQLASEMVSISRARWNLLIRKGPVHNH